MSSKHATRTQRASHRLLDVRLGQTKGVSLASFFVHFFFTMLLLLLWRRLLLILLSIATCSRRARLVPAPAPPPGRPHRQRQHVVVGRHAEWQCCRCRLHICMRRLEPAGGPPCEEGADDAVGHEQDEGPFPQHERQPQQHADQQKQRRQAEKEGWKG